MVVTFFVGVERWWGLFGQDTGFYKWEIALGL